MDLLERGSSKFKSADRRDLILIYRAGCTACQEQAAAWKWLIEDRRLENVEPWLVSLGDGKGEMQPVIDSLRRSALPYRVFRVQKIEEFVVRTGLRAVPETIVAREDANGSTLEFAQQGLADQPRLELLLNAMLDKNQRFGARILPDAQMDPL